MLLRGLKMATSWLLLSPTCGVYFPSPWIWSGLGTCFDQLEIQQKSCCFGSHAFSFCSYSLKASHHAVEDLEIEWNDDRPFGGDNKDSLFDPKLHQAPLGPFFWRDPNPWLCPWSAHSRVSKTPAKSVYWKYPLLDTWSPSICYHPGRPSARILSSQLRQGLPNPDASSWWFFHPLTPNPAPWL